MAVAANEVQRVIAEAEALVRETYNDMTGSIGQVGYGGTWGMGLVFPCSIKAATSTGDLRLS